MAYRQGDVVVGPSVFKDGRRPFVVVSNDRRPFHGEAYTVSTVTTTAREAAVTVTPDQLAAGQLARYPSYVNGWSLHVLQHRAVEKRVARLTDDALQEVAESIWTVLEAE